MEHIKNRPIVIPKATMDLLLKQDKPADLIALYLFYYYTSVWQETNQPKAVTKYTAKGLGWGVDKVRRVKKALISIGLVSDVVKRKDGKSIEGWYIRVNYCWGEKAIEAVIGNPMEKARGREKQGVAESDTNACSSNKVNACTSNKENHFEKFWKLYPRKVAKKKAQESWYKIDFNTITAQDIIKSLRAQIGSIAWAKDDGQYIPHPTTWLNQERWTDVLAQVETRRTMTAEQWIAEEVPKFRAMGYK